MADISSQYIGGYPFAASLGATDTSAAAAQAIDMSVGYLQRVALRAIRDAGDGGLTTNELSASVQIGRESIQPRTSELRSMGLIKDSGARRANSNGKKAIVWTATAQEAEVRHES
jgi:hypothetical protein